MSAMVRFSIGLFLLCWVMLPALSQGAPPGAIIQGEYIDVSEKTWQQYPEPIASPMGHPTRPWQPVGEFPWKEWGTPEKPYTATMLMYLGLDHDLYTTKYQDYSGISARMHKRGLLVQRKFYVMRETLYDSMLDVMQYDEDTASDKLGNSNIGLGKVGAGEMVNKRVLIYETPADVRGLGQVKNLFLNSPMTGWRMADAWTYSPGLRRVTRSQGGDRQDEILGTPVTLDDVGSREIWEEEHLLIGEDVVYDQMLDPQFIAPDRYENTGDFVKDGEWLARNLSRDRGELNMSPYRADGGVECWVILSKWATKTKDSMLGSKVFPNPKNYYLKYRLTWIEKVTKSPFRKEQFDHDDRLIKNGFTFNPEFYAGDFVEGGNQRTQYQMYDYRRHFRSWGSYDRTLVGTKSEAPDDWYTPEHLFREHFWKKVKLPMYKSGKEFAPAPPIHASKFPEYRGKSTGWFSDWDINYMRKTWKNHGFNDEEVDAMMKGDGVIRKGGKYYPVRTKTRPPHLHSKPLAVKFPTPGPYPITGK